MGTNLSIPSPQHRYLEPYKNRVFQYDTKHSNYFLSHYVNQILNAVGDDSIIRGLEVAAEINSAKTGLDFTISPGSLVQDLTYFEFLSETPIALENIVRYSDHYVVLYTNWRYVETVYENKLRFEATLYNPQTKKALAPWNSAKNRIILGVFSFTVEDDRIVDFKREDVTIFFDDSNVIKNGTFDTKTTDNWTPINSTAHIVESGGTLNSPYISLSPLGDVFQGIAQAFSTRPNATYEVSFYVKSEEATPFKALVLDGNCVNDMRGAEVKSYVSTSLKKWTYHTFRFNAFSTQSTIFLLKDSDRIDNAISFDHIYVFEYTPTRRMSDLNNVQMVDGGKIADQDNLIDKSIKTSCVRKWDIVSIENVEKYHIDSTMPAAENPELGYYMVFFGGRKVDENKYYVNWTKNYIEFVPGFVVRSGVEIDVYYVRKPKTSSFEWEIPLSQGVYTYSPARYQEEFPEINLGTYAVFTNGKKMDETDYTIVPSSNQIRLNEDTIDFTQISSIHICYFTDPVVSLLWSLKTLPNRTTYYLPSGSIPFPDKSKGTYLVFYDGEKVAEDDYQITPEEGCIVLDISPARANIPIKVYYFGNEEEIDETPKITNDETYHWMVELKSGVVEYRIDKTRQPLKNVSKGYYMVFVDGKKMRPTQYSINNIENRIIFSATAVSAGSIADIYYVAKPIGVTYSWTFTTQNGQYVYVPSETEDPIQDVRNGTYLVFFGDRKLVHSEFDVTYTNNSIRISRNLPVSQNVVLQAYFITNPVTNYFWNFTTVENVDSYTPSNGEKNFDELAEGEFILFRDGIKQSSESFRINVLKNVLTLSEPPRESGSKIELYFLGKE